MRLPFIITHPAAVFSSASFRSLFSPIRKYLDASSMVRVYFSQIGTSVIFKIVAPFQRLKQYHIHNGSMGFSSDGCWQQLHGNFTPSHACGCAAQCFEGVQRGSIIVLPVLSWPASRRACFAAGRWSLVPRGKSWRARRPARHRENVSDLALCCAGLRRFLCQGASGLSSFTVPGKGDGAARGQN